ncbi:MAG TPA: electron transfer flavoprotein subunit alpha/FixB family protein [Candidatus Ventrimonas merdavium]|nr:electron transfer flavoprotein subunit alpha/FixB family protein [Candidatus Ventrimonas merdavium]
MAFNSAAIGEFHDIWVFCEQREGTLSETDFELVSEGRKLADERGAMLAAVVLGDCGEEEAVQLGGYGADRVLLCSHPLLKEYTTDAYTKVLCDLVMERKPEVLLIGASHIGRDLGPRCAARLHTGLTADCTHLDIDMERYREFLRTSSSMDVDAVKFNMEDTNLKMTRPAFGGHLMATIICPRFRPCMSTVRPGVMKKGTYSQEWADRCVVEYCQADLTEQDLRTKVVEVVRETRKMADLTGAEVVVCVGRGIRQDVERGIRLAEELADALGGVVGGSRAVIDAGWLTADHQIGQTGKTVRPRLYIGLGVSGAIQHKAGMQDSERIVAIDKNDSAPIFEDADYGICGDLFEIVPLMLEELKAAVHG